MKKTKLPSIVSILLLTLITVVMWVTFDVYRLFNKTPDPIVPESVSIPLNPNLDTEIINQIEARTFLDDSQIPNRIVNSGGQEEIIIEFQNSTSAATSIP